MRALRRECRRRRARSGVRRKHESESRPPGQRRHDDREHDGDSDRAATGDPEQAQPRAPPRSWTPCSMRDADGVLHRQQHDEHELHRLVKKDWNEDGLVSPLFD